MRAVLQSQLDLIEVCITIIVMYDSGLDNDT